jgi:2-iminobutanoate/2-iminopropanoate deaminase
MADEAVMPANRAVAVSTAASHQTPGISQAVRVGDFVFVGGVIALDPATSVKVPGGAGVEAAQMLTNLDAVLAAAGLGLADVVKVTMYVRDWSDYDAVNAVYQERFAGVDPPPARATLAVSGIGADCLCELEAIAVGRPAASDGLESHGC